MQIPAVNILSSISTNGSVVEAAVTITFAQKSILSVFFFINYPVGSGPDAFLLDLGIENSLGIQRVFF